MGPRALGTPGRGLSLSSSFLGSVLPPSQGLRLGAPLSACLGILGFPFLGGVWGHWGSPNLFPPPPESLLSSSEDFP